MIILIIILFLIAGLLGGYLLTLVLKNKSYRGWIAVVHGTFAFIGLLILCAYIADDHVNYFTVGALGLIILGMLGGFTLLLKDVTHKKFPTWLVFLHPIAGISAIILLLFSVFFSNV